MKTFLLTVLMAGTLAACGTHQTNATKALTQSKEQTMETQKMKDAANNAFLALFRDYSEEGVRKYLAADIIVNHHRNQSRCDHAKLSRAGWGFRDWM